MQPRSRIRGRDPPSGGGGGGGGGRYRRRSPPPPSPRHQRRPPQPQRRSRERPPPPPLRYGDNPLPDIAAADRRSRADILLEAGRLAAHYLVEQGVLPVRVLRAREDPNHKPAPHHEPPAPSPATYGRKLDDQDDPRSQRNAGDWGRGREEHDRQPRRSNWDRRSQSFDGRRKYNDAGDVERGGRRTREYEEPKRPPMSRSYSHNDRRPSADSRVDRRRRSRSRSRSRSRTRSYHAGSRRDSDCRAGSRDFNRTKVPDSGIVPAADGDGDGDEMTRQQRVPSSVAVAEADGRANRAMAMEGGEFAQDISEDEEGEFAQDISEDEDGEFAAAPLNDEYGVGMDVTLPELSDVDVHLHPSESVEELVCSQSQLSNVVVEMEAASAPMDACLIEPLGEDNCCSEVRDEMEAPPPQSEVETSVGDLNRDEEQELPAWYKIFDLSNVEAPDGCEITEIPGDPPTDHVSDSAPYSAGQIHQQPNNDASDTQGEDEHAGDNRVLGDGHGFNKYDLNNEADEHAQDDTSGIQGQDEHAGDNHTLKDGHDFNRYDLNNEAVEDAQDNHLLDNEKLLLNHVMGAHDTDRFHLSNGQLLLNQNEDEQECDDHRMENYPVSGEQLLLSHGADGHHVNNHQMESKVMLLPTVVRDLHGYDLNSEQMLLHDGVEKHALDSCHLMDGQMLFDQSADGQARVHNMGNGQTIPVINLEDDYEEQSDTRGVF
ncbi:hypothetical protein PAHAL_7G348600 [Panicum hallii]|uniref:Uncharacterized protein n=1 Tax=Panicum hallii TaxID=206008 RepID=A0A2T8IEG7_9POAL|nr:uncharacterized protein LOC112899136 [Panicum hallii]XP_025823268.1 uncharacterized protein LOC112899136 [Panicum hallii]PVH36069.1 hypothetical protein PAHAL_7G348600 [Panicum hallii]